MNKEFPVLPKKMEIERLFMRSYRPGDGPMYYRAGVRNREHLSEFEYGNVLMHLKDEDHSEKVVQDLSEKWTKGKFYFIGLFKKSSEEWVGQLYVAPTNLNLPEYSIGFAVDVNFEGK